MAFFKYLIYLGIIGITFAADNEVTICENDEEKNFKVMERGIEVTYDSCAAFVERWPIFCDPNRPDSVHEYCCMSCKTADYVCKDEPVSLKQGKGDKLCDDLKDYLLMFCLLDKINHFCCQTCSDPEVAKLRGTCTDFKGLLFDQTCPQLAKNHGCAFCKMYGKLCCLSCIPYTEEACKAPVCEDDDQWKINVNDVTVTCPMLSEAKYRCLCGRHQRRCCITCENYNTETCTGDCEAWSRTIRGIDFNGDCSVVNTYPYLCNQRYFFNPEGLEDKGPGYCCKTCGELDEQNALGCVDDPSAMINLPDGSSVPCEEIDACECETSSTRQRCCATCELHKEERVHCGCKNLIQPEDFFTYMDEKFPTCHDLIKKYPWLCTKDEYNKMDGGKCCRKCQTTNTDCVNEPHGITDPLRGHAMTCSQLASRYPYVCKYASDEPGRENGYKDKCCAACAKIDNVGERCVDNPFWKEDIVSAGGRMFSGRTCRSLRKKRPVWMKKYVCCSEKWKAKENCCSICKDVECDSDETNT